MNVLVLLLVLVILAALAALSTWLLIDRRVEHSRLVRFKQVADDAVLFYHNVSSILAVYLDILCSSCSLNDKAREVMLQNISNIRRLIGVK